MHAKSPPHMYRQESYLSIYSSFLSKSTLKVKILLVRDCEIVASVVYFFFIVISLKWSNVNIRDVFLTADDE